MVRGMKYTQRRPQEVTEDMDGIRALHTLVRESLFAYEEQDTEMDGCSYAILGAQISALAGQGIKVTVYGPPPGACPTLIARLAERLSVFEETVTIGSEYRKRPAYIVDRKPTMGILSRIDGETFYSYINDMPVNIAAEAAAMKISPDALHRVAERITGISI